MKRKTKKVVKQVPLLTKIVFVLIVLIVVSFIVAAALATYHTVTNANRLNRIKQIYTGLDIDPSYMPTFYYVFGDKRPYSYDKSRSESSEIDYRVGKNVDATVAEFRKSIESEGFKYIGEPYPGSMMTQLHFKNDKGEYIRLTVSSKLREDAIENAAVMGQDTAQARAIDPNVGPSHVVLKVNLDDNNE